MATFNPLLAESVPLDSRVRELYNDQHRRVFCWTDRLFAWLLGVQWIAATATALWISPRAWAGRTGTIHPHVYAALFLGLAIVAFPILLAIVRPGNVWTRQAIAVAQALMAALLIHLTGGRIETHFHVFASLALLAFYRDWRVLVTASAVVAADHFVRGLVWPLSVYGTSLVTPWRFAEHAGWVVIEDIFLLVSCRQSLHEMWGMAERQARLEANNSFVSEANEQLRTEIVERQRAQRAMEIARENAESANRAKSEFLANMSHELRTPLNAVIGFSDVLVERVCGPLNDLQQQYVTDILDSGQHLLSLVNDVLDLAKIESGTMDLDCSTILVPAFVSHTVQMFRERALRQRIKLSTEIDDELPSLCADERRLKQVLYNFLSNALKFTPEGGTITVGARASDDGLLLSVADSGIAADEQAKVFDTFYQVDSSLTKGKQGTGLGLALVKRIADLHSGRAWVESQPGQGSEFFLWLPAEPALVASATAEPDWRTSSLHID